MKLIILIAGLVLSFSSWCLEDGLYICKSQREGKTVGNFDLGVDYFTELLGNGDVVHSYSYDINDSVWIKNEDGESIKISRNEDFFQIVKKTNVFDSDELSPVYWSSEVMKLTKTLDDQVLYIHEFEEGFILPDGSVKESRSKLKADCEYKN